MAARWASIWAVRFEKTRSCASLNPVISRQPLRSGPQPTPSRADSRRRNPSWYTDPAAFAQRYRAVASLATQTPSSRRTTLGITAWVCNWGSPSRLARCTKVAAAHPDVVARWRCPPICRRVTAARPSTNPNAAWTASTWQIDTAVATSGGPNAHSSDTLLALNHR